MLRMLGKSVVMEVRLDTYPCQNGFLEIFFNVYSKLKIKFNLKQY